MAISFPAGFPIAENGDTLATPTPPSVTMPAAYGADADFAFLFGLFASTTLTVTASSSNAQSHAWEPGPRLVDTVNGYTLVFLNGVAQDTSTPDIVDLTYGGATTGIIGNWWPGSLTAGLGPTTQWTVGAGPGFSGTGTTINYETATPFANSNPQAALWFAGSSSTATGESGGGYNFIDSPTNSGNEMVSNLGIVSGGGPYAPTSSQTGTFYDTIYVVVEAFVTTGAFILPGPQVSLQAVTRASFR